MHTHKPASPSRPSRLVDVIMACAWPAINQPFNACSFVVRCTPFDISHIPHIFNIGWRIWVSDTR